MAYYGYFCPCGANYLANIDGMPFRRCIYCGRKVKLQKPKKPKKHK